MSSNCATSTPVWNRFHSSRPCQRRAVAKPSLPARPATSPTLPTQPVATNDTNDNHDFKETHSVSKVYRSDHRWSEVVPPATALTFAAVWDPEEGLVTFSGASLSASENGRSNASPEDADALSQVLTIDFLNLGTSPNTAKDSILYPYSQSRFAMSELSTQHFPISATRRSSAGTGLALDTSVCPELEKQMKGGILSGQNSDVHTESGARDPTRAVHQHSSHSQDSGTSNSLTAFGFGLCNPFRRDTAPKHGYSRAERYGFLRRVAGKVNEGYTEDNERDEKVQIRLDDPSINTPPKSAGLRSIFARSIWLRGGIGAGRDGGHVYKPQMDDYHDGISLDSGFDRIDIDDGMDGTWLGELGGGREELDAALRRDVDKLKSTFSWTTTSTSRYVDVAAFLDLDSDSDSTASSLGAPIASTMSPLHSQCGNSASAHACASDYDPEWHRIAQPTLRPGRSMTPSPIPQRKLLKKPSKAQIAIPPPAKAASHRKDATAKEDLHRYQIYSQCHLRIGCADLEVTEKVAHASKGKGRANSQPELPDSIRNTVSFGRPAALRSSSYPASLPFSHTRSRSLPGSTAATPAEVLSRASYNHEWSSPVPSRPISHSRSSSAPQQGSTVTAMSTQRSTTPTRACQHMADMRDVMRGVRSGIRPSTPIPGMPPVPPKSRPPPTSFRPVSAGGRERGRSQTPTSPAHSHGRFPGRTPLTRSQSHRTSNEAPSRFLSRTRSLESLRGTAQALASASTAPLRSLWRSRSFIRNSHSDQPRQSDVDDDEDGVWVCVDIKVLDDKAKVSSSSEGQCTSSSPSRLVENANSPRASS